VGKFQQTKSTLAKQQ